MIIFSDHNGMKLEMNHRKREGKDSMETTQHATKSQWINGGNQKKEMKKYLEMSTENTTI